MKPWCIVPAAGTGSRLGAEIPKQYLDLAGRPLLAWTLDALRAVDPAAIVLVISATDAHAERLGLGGAGVELLPRGGAERADSVLAGLDALADRADDADWVLVHDAARPCVDPGRIRALIAAVTAAAQRADSQGGLLAVPIAETVKRSRHLSGDAASRTCAVTETLDRRDLWLAQTPQMFRVGALREALRAARAQARMVTDEASAMEAMGVEPLLIESDAANLKVTRPADLALAEFWLLRQGRVTLA